MGRGLVILLVVMVAAGCPVEEPLLDADPGPVPDAGRVHADLVLAYTEGGALMTCSSVPGCPPDGPCAQHPVLGPADGVTFDLEAGGRLEIAFLCTALLEGGGAPQSPDFQIRAQVPSGASAIVAASADGTRFETVDTLTTDDQAFDLSRTSLDAVRFLRLTAATSGPPIPIDAIHSLP